METSIQLCPDFAGFLCRPWPDDRDDTFPPLVQFRLSELAPPLAHAIFGDALHSAVKISDHLFVADPTFWQLIRTAQLRCNVLGINSGCVSIAE